MPLVSEWISFFNNAQQSGKRLKRDYGNNYKYLDFKRSIILDLLYLHKSKFGNEEVIIIRAPGRINLMGRHIDHQGGNVNLIAIDQEIFITASLREDYKIFAYNIDDINFNKVEIDFSNFRIMDHEEWIDLIENEKFLERYKSKRGDWANFIKAAYLRLLDLYGSNKIFGVNLCASGNIMIAAGLSSSTSLTMGTFEALCKLNKINLAEGEIINYCAEAEWFVGTRGGSADQVAIKCAKLDQIIYVKLFSLQILDWIKFPKDYDLLVVNSNIISDKSGSKKDLYNEKVLAYELGFYLIKMKFPKYASMLKYLRDINPENLKNRTNDIIELLREIPEYIHHHEFATLIGDKWHEIKQHYQFNTLPYKLPIRKIIAYGIAECERSKKFYNFIKEGDFISAGKLMYISHDGDRIFKFNDKLEEHPHINELDNDKLEHYHRGNYTLDQISGGYGASIAEIDFIIDLAKNSEGVLGAQISGAGMGGCAMIFVKRKQSDKIKNLIKLSYNNKFGKSCSILTCKPVKGLSILYNI